MQTNKSQLIKTLIHGRVNSSKTAELMLL